MRIIALLPVILLLACSTPPRDETPFRRVGTPLSAMPAGDDGSTPEAGYAALLRALVTGTSDPRPLFHSKVHSKLPAQGIRPRPEPRRSQILGARIEEVLEQGDFATVIAVVGPIENDGVELRFMQREGGRWRALGNDTFSSMDRARAKARKSLAVVARTTAAPAPARVADPDAHRARFSAFLASSGRDPKAFLLGALGTSTLVAFGEIHNRVASWELLTRLVQDPAFPERAGTIYMELPRHTQPLMDRFLAGRTLDVEPVREILRSMFQSGWPCKDEVDFLAAVWTVNRKLPADRRLRVVLVDQAWDWSRVKVKEDVATLQADRDTVMADAIVADLARRPDARHALFQVGYLHLPSALVPKGGGAPYPSAGQRLRATLGSQLFTVLQHAPVMGNRGGQLDGRVRRGLFDEAFAGAGNRPVAFAIRASPFGEEPFDMSMDLRGFEGTYGTAFDGYLFLGPLDEDRHSAVAPGFYTDAFAREVDRRYRLTSGGGVKEAEDIEAVSGAALEAGKARWMGRPAAWVGKLGSIDAWRRPK